MLEDPWAGLSLADESDNSTQAGEITLQPPRNHSSTHKDAADAFIYMKSHDICMCGLGSCIWRQDTAPCNCYWWVWQA